MNRFGLAALCLLGIFLPARAAFATKSAELYTSAPYGYGRFETRVRFAAGDGVVSAFFLWKDGSEKPDTFWNELDYEKIGANCQLSTNALYGNPSANHTTKPTVSADLCTGFHVYGYEWTADYIAWSFDGKEIRRETGEAAAAFAQNASAGMQIHFNLWPGDSSFGGNFSPSILPVHQYIDWVQYSSYANGAFTLTWREDFTSPTAPTGWLTGDWGSPKNLSTHDPRNVNFLGGYAVVSLTADDATGPAGAMSGPDGGGTSGMGGGGAATSGAAGMAQTVAGASAGGAASIAGAATVGGSNGNGAAAGTSAGGASAPGSTNPGGATGTQVGTTSGTGGAQPTAGAPAGAGTNGDDANGSGCHVPGATRPSQSGAGALLLLALAAAFRRRLVSRG
ncbi:MAG TPA: glycoside hydrolase family 16 protein [Polyangiaceae bacterium]|nr:glycoside hydrolase family 16 protein [Polyangiaceae bacterium]